MRNVFWIILFAHLKMYALCEVVQLSEAIKADPGGTVTLACFYSSTYNGESKHWYRQILGLKPHAMVRYRVGNVAWNHPFSEDFKRGRMTTHQSERSFNLTIRNITSSDEATYYCTVTVFDENKFGNGTFLAVTGPRKSYEHAAFFCAVTNSWCGQINNGNTSDLNTEKSLSPVVYGLIAVLGLCFLLISLLVHLIYQHRKYKHNRNKSSHPVNSDRTLRQPQTTQDADELVNYAALHFSDKKMKRGKKKRDLPHESIYSDVKH